LRPDAFSPPAWRSRQPRNHRRPQAGYSAGDRGERGRYQLPLSPVPYRPPFDARPAPPPPSHPPPTRPPQFFDDYRPPLSEERGDYRPPQPEQRGDYRPPLSEERGDYRSPQPEQRGDYRPSQPEERAAHLGSGDYIILRGGSFVEPQDYRDNQLQSRPRPYHDHPPYDHPQEVERLRSPNIFTNFRDFAEFAHGSEISYQLAKPESSMSTAETSASPVNASSPLQSRGPVSVASPPAANIQDILSEISNDVQTDQLAGSTTSHVKKRVLHEKRVALQWGTAKRASVGSQASEEDPMVATF